MRSVITSLARLRGLLKFCSMTTETWATVALLRVPLYGGYTLRPVVQPLYNRLDVCIHNAAGCTTRWENRFDTGCIVYTNIFLLDQPIVQPVVQLVAASMRTFG